MNPPATRRRTFGCVFFLWHTDFIGMVDRTKEHFQPSPSSEKLCGITTKLRFDFVSI
jgi:hypothetical protein